MPASGELVTERPSWANIENNLAENNLAENNLAEKKQAEKSLAVASSEVASSGDRAMRAAAIPELAVELCEARSRDSWPGADWSVRRTMACSS